MFIWQPNLFKSDGLRMSKFVNWETEEIKIGQRDERREIVNLLRFEKVCVCVCVCISNIEREREREREIRSENTFKIIWSIFRNLKLYFMGVNSE